MSELDAPEKAQLKEILIRWYVAEAENWNPDGNVLAYS